MFEQLEAQIWWRRLYDGHRSLLPVVRGSCRPITMPASRIIEVMIYGHLYTAPPPQGMRRIVFALRA